MDKEQRANLFRKVQVLAERVVLGSATEIQDALSSVNRLLGKDGSTGPPDHLQLALGFADSLRFPVARWKAMTPARERLLKRRMKAVNVSDPEEFWRIARKIWSGVSGDFCREWRVPCEIEHLLKVPQAGQPDHWQRASEGYYSRGESKVSQPQHGVKKTPRKAYELAGLRPPGAEEEAITYEEWVRRSQ